MRRHLLLLSVLLLPAVASGDEASDRERFAELRSEYRGVANGVDWSAVKRRRAILKEICLLDTEEALPLLWENFRSDREVLCRLQAMRGLATGGPTTIRKRLVTAALRDRNDLFTLVLPRVFTGVRDDALCEWLVTKVLPRSRGELERAAVVRTLGLLGTRCAFEPIRELLADGIREPRVAREALLSLARIDGERAAPLIEPYLADESAVTRESAVLAFTATGVERAALRLVPLADDDSARVQDAVAASIGELDREIALPVLIGLLRSSRLRVVDTARAALEKTTGEDFGTDVEAWAHWFATRDDEEKKPRAGLPDGAASVTSYYGLRVLSDRVLFVLDVSGSMKAGRPPRLETAKRELARTLSGLSPATRFNVVTFSGSAMWWRDELAPATPANIEAAKEFVDDLTAGGGTNVYDTVTAALERHPRLDTIFLLGDGSPSAGRVTDQAEIHARIAWMTRLSRVRIHTIALLPAPGLAPPRSDLDREEDPEEAARFMAGLAAATGGTFVRIDR